MDKFYEIDDKKKIKEFIKDSIDKSFDVKVQTSYNIHNDYNWFNYKSDKGLSFVLNEMSENSHLIISHRIYNYNNIEYIEIVVSDMINSITINLSINYLGYFIEKYNLKLI